MTLFGLPGDEKRTGLTVKSSTVAVGFLAVSAPSFRFKDGLFVADIFCREAGTSLVRAGGR